MAVVMLLLHGCAAIDRYTSRHPAQSSAPQTDYYSKADIKYHTVQTGETLYSISRLYGVNYKEIANWNNLYPPYTIYPGQSLQISNSYVAAPAYGSGGVPVNTSPPSQGKRINATKPDYQTGGQYQKSQSRGTYHTVQRGETLYSIAKRYGQNYLTVAQWNNLSSPYRLSIGQHLRISASQGRPDTGRRMPPSISGKNATVSHVVRQGETLSSIARQYGYSAKQIAYWNGLRPPYGLKVGRRLRVAPLSTNRTTHQARRSTLSTQSSSQKASYHRVVAGDTLYSLSRTYGSDITDIATWNQLQPPYTLSPGQTLQVAPINKKIPSNKGPQSVSSSVRHNTGYHTVARGETLYSISKIYGYRVSEIATWNRLRYPYNLKVGQSVRVYPPSGVLEATRYKYSPRRTASRRNRQTYHTVVRGDTLYSISKRYGHAVSQVASWNQLVPPYQLSVGQRLRVAP